MPKTRSIPYWTTIVFSSTVTNFVLIYESLTFDVGMMNHSRMNRSLHGRLYSPAVSMENVSYRRKPLY
jgi:hypothetical protein